MSATHVRLKIKVRLALFFPCWRPEVIVKWYHVLQGTNLHLFLHNDVQISSYKPNLIKFRSKHKLLTYYTCNLKITWICYTSWELTVTQVWNLTNISSKNSRGFEETEKSIKINHTQLQSVQPTLTERLLPFPVSQAHYWLAWITSPASCHLLRCDWWSSS